MKKIIKKFTLITLIISCVVASVSCGSGMKKYSENGLNFSLPRDMKKQNVSYADLCYGNEEFVQFFVYFYSKDSLLTELALDKEATVKEYADWFVGRNGYTGVEENYDETNNVIVLKYIYVDEDENDYYCDYITRNEHALFHVTMCCKADFKDKNAPVFDEWMKHISID